MSELTTVGTYVRVAVFRTVATLIAFETHTLSIMPKRVIEDVLIERFLRKASLADCVTEVSVLLAILANSKNELLLKMHTHEDLGNFWNPNIAKDKYWQ